MIRRGRNRRGRERKECRSCTCGEGQGGCGRKKLLGRGGSIATDLEGLWISSNQRWCLCRLFVGGA